ncbi:MAG: mevalonate kinase family protein [Pseudomonadales bacterium]
MTVTALAPGKLVLWGEYAVLNGAPAAAIAVDRYAQASFEATAEDAWHISTPGLSDATHRITIPGLIIGRTPAADAQDALLWHVLSAMKGHVNQLPSGGRLTLDSRAFYLHQHKLGLGSSAAVCTAITQLLLHIVGATPEFATAFLAHRSAQMGRGSGIDIAAAHCGGVVCLTPSATNPDSVPDVSPYDWPDDLHWQAYWTGRPAKTTTHINRFTDWLAGAADTSPLQRLTDCAVALGEGLDLARLEQYIQALREFDQAAQVGVYTPMHAELHNLAQRRRLLYKPCGAGGGDTGIAVSDNADDLVEFTQAAALLPGNHALQPLDLRLSEYGIRISP